MLKIEQKKLKSFLKKAIMDGKSSMMECLLKFDDEGLKVKGTNDANQAGVDAVLKSSAFKEYDSIGNVGMNGLPTLLRVLDRFEDVISMKVEGNLLTISNTSGSKKSVGIELVDESYLNSSVELPELEYEETFNLLPGKLKEVFSDMGVNSNCELIIETRPNEVVFKNTGKYKFETLVNSPPCKGGHTVRMGSPFVHALENLDSGVEINMGSDMPIKAVERTDDSVISIIVAPRTDEQ